MIARDRPDFSFLTKYVKESIEKKERGERVKDFEHYVFELSLEAVYGATCWEEYNKIGTDG